MPHKRKYDSECDGCAVDREKIRKFASHVVEPAADMDKNNSVYPIGTESERKNEISHMHNDANQSIYIKSEELSNDVNKEGNNDESDEVIRKTNETIQNEINKLENELIEKSKFKYEEYVKENKKDGKNETDITTMNEYLKRNKEEIKKLLELQRKILIRCSECRTYRCITDVCKIEHEGDRIFCKNCSIKYDYKKIKDLNKDKSTNFLAICNRCHTIYKPLLRTMRHYKGKNEIEYRQCSTCCIRKYVNDRNKKKIIN